MSVNNIVILRVKEDKQDSFAEIMKQAPVSIAIGAMLFFYRLGNKLSRFTIASLMEEVEEGQKPRTKDDLLKNGGGINQSMLSLEAMYGNLMKSQLFHYTNA